MDLPARIGKYELVEFLGGRHGPGLPRAKTHSGAHRGVEDPHRRQGNDDPDTRKRFLLEARTASKVDHENIISVFDFGEEQGRPFMVMEFLRGQSLREAIKEGNRVGDLRARVSIGIQVARALEHIHEHKNHSPRHQAGEHPHRPQRGG